MERAWHYARELLKKPELARRYTRVVLTQNIKRRMHEELSYGLLAEGHGVLESPSSEIPKAK
jgi:hypothetical protein